jgi:hypothetical protein
VISVYVDVEGDISWRDVISMIEITTINWQKVFKEVYC